MGFDVCHLNLHKTFATPTAAAAGQRPGGVQGLLAPFLPGSALCRNGGEHSIGQVRAFHANFLVVVRALAYLLRLGNTGVAEAAHTAVLNANYLKGSWRRRAIPPPSPACACTSLCSPWRS